MTLIKIIHIAAGPFPAVFFFPPLLKFFYNFFSLFFLRYFIVGLPPPQRIVLSNQSARLPPQKYPRHIIQIKRLYLYHPFQRIGT